MGGRKVGGDPPVISAGARQLLSTSHAVSDMSRGFTQAGTQASGAVGNAHLSGSLDRFAAAWSRMSADTGVELTAAGTLAKNSAIDLAVTGRVRAE